MKSGNFFVFEPGISGQEFFLDGAADHLRDARPLAAFPSCRRAVLVVRLTPGDGRENARRRLDFVRDDAATAAANVVETGARFNRKSFEF